MGKKVLTQTDAFGACSVQAFSKVIDSSLALKMEKRKLLTNLPYQLLIPTGSAPPVE